MLNIPQILQLLKFTQNPQQAAMNLFQQNTGDNPMAQNIINLANAGDSKGLEQIARNLCKAKGVDIEQMIRQLKS